MSPMKKNPMYSMRVVCSAVSDGAEHSCIAEDV